MDSRPTPPLAIDDVDLDLVSQKLREVDPLPEAEAVAHDDGHGDHDNAAPLP
jgi:hypothetical protein